MQFKYCLGAKVSFMEISFLALDVVAAAHVANKLSGALEGSDTEAGEIVAGGPPRGMI